MLIFLKINIYHNIQMFSKFKTAMQNQKTLLKSIAHKHFKCKPNEQWLERSDHAYCMHFFKLHKNNCSPFAFPNFWSFSQPSLWFVSQDQHNHLCWFSSRSWQLAKALSALSTLRQAVVVMNLRIQKNHILRWCCQWRAKKYSYFILNRLHPKRQ